MKRSLHLGSSPGFFGRPGVSELYASLLMIGVTLSLGGTITAAAIGQYGLQSSSASASGGVEQASVGKLVSLVYAVAAPGSGGCAKTYSGATEGDSLAFALFDYGTAAFTPSAIVVNSTVYSSTYPTLEPGGMATYTVALSGCAHSSGQTLLLVDKYGDEVEIGT